MRLNEAGISQQVFAFISFTHVAKPAGSSGAAHH